MHRRTLPIAAIGFLLGGTAVANTELASTLLTWEGIQREFARRSLSERLMRHEHGSWVDIEQFFTDETREALAALTNHALLPTATVDELLLFDARVSHCEMLGITDHNSSWEVVCNEHMRQLSRMRGEVYGYFLSGHLFDEQKRFWAERIDRLFPFMVNDPIPLRPEDDTI